MKLLLKPSFAENTPLSLHKIPFMPKPVVPYNNSEASKKQQVQKMFDGISEEYDDLNRVITFGIDLKWRRNLIEQIVQSNPNRVLDVATGTGDLAIELAQRGVPEITGLDLSPGMLEIGKDKIKKQGLGKHIDMLIGDSEQLPFKDNTFDAVTVAFGVRNFENLELGLNEILRVLKPGGILGILETSVPSNPIVKLGYMLHSNLLLPGVGRLFSKDNNAYGYLSKSAVKFPYRADFISILESVGFLNCKYESQTLGVACLYFGSKL